MSRATPGGWHTVTPRIVVEDAAGLVDFVKVVFGATGELGDDSPAQIGLGDSLIMVSRATERESFLAFLYVYVENADDRFSISLPRASRYCSHRVRF